MEKIDALNKSIRPFHLKCDEPYLQLSGVRRIIITNIMKNENALIRTRVGCTYHQRVGSLAGNPTGTTINLPPLSSTSEHI